MNEERVELLDIALKTKGASVKQVVEHGYWCSGSGSYHALIPAAAEAWGLPVSGYTASEPQRITDALSSGKLVVAIMSAGHFTSSGHFIVSRMKRSSLPTLPAERAANKAGNCPSF